MFTQFEIILNKVLIDSTFLKNMVCWPENRKLHKKIFGF